MPTKVTLSISDDLAEKIRRYRDRLNQSAIFAEAISKEIVKLELQSMAGDLTTAFERLRGQYGEYEKQHYLLGYQAGLAWATDEAHYADLKRLATAYGDPTLFISQVMDVCQSGHPMPPSERNKLMDLSGNDPAHFNREGYARGWIDAVNGVWKMVAKKG